MYISPPHQNKLIRYIANVQHTKIAKIPQPVSSKPNAHNTKSVSKITSITIKISKNTIPTNIAGNIAKNAKTAIIFNHFEVITLFLYH